MTRIHQFRFPPVVILIWFALLLEVALSARASDYLLDVWTSDNDLPDSSVAAIAQTPDGYLWIGTFNGLARFDGVRFVTFDPANTPELKNSRISGLFVDARGALWINTYDGSLTRLANGVFTHERDDVKVISMLSISNRVLFTLTGHRSKLICWAQSNNFQGEWNDISLAGTVTGNNVKQDGIGNIWYLINKDLYRMTGTNSVLMAPSSGWRGSGVNSLSTDDTGDIWIGTDEGIFRWSDGQFEDQTPTDAQTNVDVHYLFSAGNGCWVFGDGKVRKCVNRQWVAEATPKEWRDLAGTFALDLNAYQDREGGLWFTHPGAGLFHLKANGEAEHLSTANGLPANSTSCWFQDHEGNIWVGLNPGGLVRLRKREFQTVESASGLDSQAVSSICEDGQSNIWIGTFSGGLYRWRDSKAVRFDLPNGPYEERFFCVFPDSRGRLWLSAGREDLYILENGQIAPSRHVVHGIKAITVDREGRSWFGTVRGLSYMDGGSLKKINSTNGLNDIRSLAEDHNGGIWIGEDDGKLFYYGEGKLSSYTPDDEQNQRPVLSLLPESDGTLWIGTKRGGLLRFRHGKFSRYSLQDGLPDDIISQILDDGQGRLWMGSHRGIFYTPINAFEDFDTGKIKTLPCVSFGLSDGLPALECSGNYQPACWRDHTGRLWFATVKGPVSILPRELTLNSLPPPVVIEEVSVNGKPTSQTMTAGSLVVSPGERQLDFRYTGLSFMAPEKVEFRYMLEGIDEDWMDAGTKRSVRYGPLRPGKYIFRVIACNNNGVWNETGASINLVLRPYFWQTWWFKISTISASIAALFLAIRYSVKRKMQQKLEKLKQQQALQNERMRIARDLHDDLGATVAQVGLMIGELADTAENKEWREQVGTVSGRVRSLARDLDAVVWSVNPGEDSLDGLSGYLSNYFLETLRPTGIRPRLNVDDDIPSVPLKPEVRHQLFLIAKEAINNVIKHSQTKEARLEIRVKDDWFELGIQDDGRGFALEAAEHSRRNGLRNMRARAVEMRCTFDVSGGPGVGTSIRLRYPLPQASSDSRRKS